MVSEEVGRSETEIPLEGGEAGPSARIKDKGKRLEGWEAGRRSS